MSRTTLINIHYTDDHSVNHDAFRDFAITLKFNIFGCNKRPCAHLQPGDRIIIHAKRESHRRLIIGEVIDRLQDDDILCNAWSFLGGSDWAYNYSFKPLSEVIEYDEQWADRLRGWCDARNLRLNVLMSRCNNDYLPVVDEWLKWLSVVDNGVNHESTL